MTAAVLGLAVVGVLGGALPQAPATAPPAVSYEDGAERERRRSRTMSSR